MNKKVEAICPTCGKKHKIKIYWKGNGTPRIRCKECKQKIKNIDDRPFYIASR